MSTHEESPTYIGDVYRHVRTGFSGEVMKEAIPSPWTPDKVLLTLESNGGSHEFPLSELVEIEEG
jgi:hypothetical protein